MDAAKWGRLYGVEWRYMNERRSIGGMTLAGKTEVLGEKHAKVALCPP